VDGVCQELLEYDRDLYYKAIAFAFGLSHNAGINSDEELHKRARLEEDIIKYTLHLTKRRALIGEK
jgi:hypothetical protein